MKFKVYGSSYCPFCSAARGFLNQYEIPFEDVVIDDPAERQKLYDQLNLVDPNRTVPQIFIDNARVGGWKEFQKTDLFKAIAAGNFVPAEKPEQ